MAPVAAPSGHARAVSPGVLFAFFFLSGATALLYEVVWLRQLGLVFGHTVYAITTVLAAFMAGLGLGSALLGRRAASFRDPIRAYGVLEIGIGLSCALVPVLVWITSFVYPALSRSLGLSAATFGFAQFLLVFGLLLVPTTLMGGTLPVLSHALVSEDGRIGRTVGTLYAVNTFGAVVGVFLAGYVLLPAYGNRATLAIAVVANLAVGAAAIAYSRRLGAPDRTPRLEAGRGPAIARAPGAPSDARDLGAWLTLAALGISGAVSMIYEVAWTRALALVIGSSTYAFSAMLLAFLLGIAGGAAVYSLLWGRGRSSAGSFALIQCGIGLAAMAVLLLFDRLPDLVVRATGRSASPAFVNVIQFVVSAHALLPSTLLIGATFPCAVAVWARAPGRAASDVGWLYAVNTLGAIIGAVLAGFVLVPGIGVHASIKVGIVANLLLAAALAAVPLRALVGGRAGTFAIALAAAVAVPFIEPWDTLVISSGPAIYAGNLLRSGRSVADTVRGRTEVVYYRDGASATVTVTRDPDSIALRVNGKVDASTGRSDMPTQLMLGHLPLLVHPDPKTVLVIGLGSGISAGSVARHPITRLDIVEIEAAVVGGSAFFAGLNHNVLEDPRVRLTISDGRNFLLTAADGYDVIASEPSNPWLSGVASLFSLEFFRIARQHLRPGGIMLQWVHAYSLLPEDLQMIVRTFQTVFPETSVWNVAGGDFLLLGRLEPAPLDLERLKNRYESNPALREDLASIGISGWGGVLGFFMLDAKDALRYAAGAPLNTDDRLRLEFSAPRALYLDTGPLNWRRMRSFRTIDLPDVTAESRGELERSEVRWEIGETLLRLGAPDDAQRYFAPAPASGSSRTPSPAPARSR